MRNALSTECASCQLQVANGRTSAGQATDGLRGFESLSSSKLKVLITNLTSDYMSYKLSTIREAFNKSGSVKLIA